MPVKIDAAFKDNARSITSVVFKSLIEDLGMTLTYTDEYKMYIYYSDSTIDFNGYQANNFKTAVLNNTNRSKPTIVIGKACTRVNKLLGGTSNFIEVKTTNKIYQSKDIIVDHTYLESPIPMNDGFVLMVDKISKTSEIIFYPQLNLLLFCPDILLNKEIQKLFVATFKKLWFKYKC